MEAWISMVNTRELQFEKSLHDMVSKHEMYRRNKNYFLYHLYSFKQVRRIPSDIVKPNGEHLLETDSPLVHIGIAVTTLGRYEKFMLLVRIVEEDFPPIARRIFIEFLLAELGHEYFSCMLAEYGVDLNHEMKNKGALLPYVAHLNDKELLEKLLPVNPRVSVESIVDENDKLNLLHYAAKGSADKVVRYLIDKGANVSVTDNFGRTPLHYAALSDDPKTAGLLIHAGAKLDTKDALGLSPTFYAVFGRSMKILNLFKKRGADISELNSHFGTPLHIAAINNDVELTLTLKKLGGLTLNKEKCENPDYGSFFHQKCFEQPIIYALYQRSYDVAKILARYRPIARYRQSRDGSTPLHIIACQNDVEMINFLIKAGADINAQDRFGNTPLLALLKQAEMKMDALEAFLRHNPDLSISGSLRFTPLHTAIHQGKNATVIEKLIRAGSPLNAVTVYGETPLMMAVDLRSSADIVQLLLNDETVNFMNPVNGKTSLHYAAERKNKPIVRMLLQAGAVSDIEDNSGATPLKLAILADAIGPIQVFIEMAKELDAIKKNAMTIIAIACRKNNVKVLKSLETNGIDLNRDMENGVTLLMIASEYNSNDVTRYLMQKDVVVNTVDQTKKWTALHYAAKGNNHAIIKELVDAGADINLQDGDGWTPLKIASYHGSVEAVAKLLELKANVGLADKHYETPLHAAARSDNEAIVDKLINIGGASFYALNDDGYTPYHVAIASNANRVVEYMISNQFSTIPETKRGYTFLHLAAEGDNVDFIKKHLPKAFQLFKQKDIAGKTALHTAAYHDSIRIIDYLVGERVDLGAVDNEGRTALFDAVQNNKIETIGYLMSWGVPIHIKDKNKQTALDFARKLKMRSMVEYLKPYYDEKLY